MCLLKACKRWKPEHGGAFRRAECALLAFADDSFAADLAALHTAHVLVRLQLFRHPEHY